MIYAKKTVWQRVVAFVGLGVILGFGGALVVYRIVTDVPNLDTVEMLFDEGKDVFVLEVAQTPSTRQRGLMERTELCERCGMLFVFPETNMHTFWMKDTPLSLDIIWVRDGEVVYIVEHTTPFSEDAIIPHEDARQVIELAAGSVARYGIHIGDAVYQKQ